MTQPASRIAILMHTDNLDEAQEKALESLVGTARLNKEILKITQERVNGILQITVLYRELTYAMYDFFGALQNPNGPFAEPRTESEIEERVGVKGLINRTIKGFLMVLSGDINYIKSQLKNPLTQVEVDSLLGGERKRLAAIRKMQQKTKKIRLPRELYEKDETGITEKNTQVIRGTELLTT